LHQHEPVPEVQSLRDHRDVQVVRVLRAVLEDREPDLSGSHCGDPVDEEDGCPDSEADIPEPEDDVDLLDDDVEGEDAQTVIVLDGSRGAVLVERALSHLREGPGHGVYPILSLHIGHRKQGSAILREGPPQEGVHQVHLPHDVDEVEELAEEELGGVDVVLVEVTHHVADYHLPFSLVGGLLVLQRLSFSLEALEEGFDPPSLQVLPDGVRKVAEDGLEAEHEADPLVPGVTDLIALVGHSNVAELGGGVSAHSGVWEVLSLSAHQMTLKCKSSVYPAVRLKHIFVDSLHNAGDLVSKELLGSGEGAAGAKKPECHLVVELECGVVY